MQIRDQARFKIFPVHQLENMLAEGSNLYIPKAHKGCKYRTLSAHTTWCFTDRLSKVNKAKLDRMMQPGFPFFEYVGGVGFKVPHKRTGDPVYVIAGEFNIKTQDPERQTVMLRKFEPSTFNRWTTHTWAHAKQEYVLLPIETQVQTYMRNHVHNVKPVYVDRLTKAEIGKLSMLYLLESNSYIPGIGGMFMRYRWDYVLKKNVEDGPVYFLEK